MRWVVPFVIALSVCVSAVASDSETGLASDGPQVVKLSAKKYVFEPSTITVVRGRPVRIEATAVDRDHGLELQEFGVKQKIEKGKTSIIEFTPDRAGEFTFHCSVFCGLGHHGMKGKLIVTEPAGS